MTATRWRRKWREKKVNLSSDGRERIMDTRFIWRSSYLSWSSGFVERVAVSDYSRMYAKPAAVRKALEIHGRIRIRSSVQAPLSTNRNDTLKAVWFRNNEMKKSSRGKYSFDATGNETLKRKDSDFTKNLSMRSSMWAQACDRNATARFGSSAWRSQFRGQRALNGIVLGKREKARVPWSGIRQTSWPAGGTSNVRWWFQETDRITVV
jgi:hypothetical protein